MISNPAIETVNLSNDMSNEAILNLDLSNYELIYTFSQANQTMAIPDITKKYFIFLRNGQQSIDILDINNNTIFTYLPSAAGVGSNYRYNPLLLLFKFSSEAKYIKCNRNSTNSYGIYIYKEK